MIKISSAKTSILTFASFERSFIKSLIIIIIRLVLRPILGDSLWYPVLR